MSFCDIQFGKNNKGEHTAVNNEGKESRLYPRLVLDLSEIQNRKAAYTANKEYVDNLVSQNKIAGRSAVDIAKALYGAAHLSGLPEAEFMMDPGFQKLVYNKNVATEQGAAIRPGVQEAAAPFDKDTKYQLASEEGRIASEKTIRDLVATASDRIGMRYKIISDRSQVFKGKIEDNVAVINLSLIHI